MCFSHFLLAVLCLFDKRLVRSKSFITRTLRLSRYPQLSQSSEYERLSLTFRSRKRYRSQSLIYTYPRHLYISVLFLSFSFLLHLFLLTSVSSARIPVHS